MIEETHLLKVIKEHVYQRWETACEKQPKIWEFIKKVNDESKEDFEMVLRRAAEYGSEYTKSSSMLSIVLQLLFTGIDDDCLLNEPKVFADLWNSVTNEGIASCDRFKQYISEDDLKEQMNEPSSSLILALHLYYQEKVPELLKQHHISNSKNTLYNLAAESVTQHGWISGIQAIKGKIPPNKYEPLIKKIREMVSSISTSLEEPSPCPRIPSSVDQSSQDTSGTTNLQILPNIAKPPDNMLKSTSSTSDQQQQHPSSTHSVEQSPTREITNSVHSSPIQISDDADIIQKCILTEPLKLQDLIEAGELKYNDKTLKEIAQDLVNRFFNDHTTPTTNFSKFVQACLHPIMFLIKRQQNLDDFMKTLTFAYEKMKRERATQSLSSDKAVPLSLRAFQHILLSSSDIFLRRIIMSLISKRNPVPFVEPNIEDRNGPAKHEIMASVVHVWNAQRPTLLSFSIGPCRGKSSLINSLFQSTFERHINSIYFDCTIDIDFGYSFIPERSFNVADCHGELPMDLLKTIRKLFDGFIIHVNQEYLEKNTDAVTELLQLLPSDKFQIILVRDVTSNFNEQRCLRPMNALLTQGTTPITPLMNMSDTNNSETQYLLEDLRENLLEKIKLYVPSNIDKDDLFFDLHKLLKPDYVTYLKHTTSTIKPLKKCLLGNKSELNDQSFPLYLQFTVLCKLRQELKKIDFYGSDGDRSFKINAEIFRLEHEFEQKDKAVISIVGPQNSGKSTLLNYMFGTLFDVRDGRCTRGIYGSLVKANIPGINYILLIDTEGLLAVEKADKEYDRRLVLFCLGISHLVLVNMVGDVNETMKDMLTLCADSLKQLNVTTIPQPAIYFILNQKADPNIKNHTEAINKIISELKEKDLGDIINISEHTFHTLPSAFKKERILNDTTGPCLLRTEPDFLERTQKLVADIIASAKICYDRTNDANFTLRQWLSTSKTIFETLQKYPDLTYFKDINERRQDEKLRTLIREMITATLSATERQKMIDQHCEKREKEIRDEFQAAFQIHLDDFNDRLEDYLKLENAAERIRDRSRQFLARQVTETRNAWCTSTIEANDRKRMEALVRDGAADLKDLIDDIIKKGKTMTNSDAIDEFEGMWRKKLISIKNPAEYGNVREQENQDQIGNTSLFRRAANWVRGGDGKKKERKQTASSSHTSNASLRPLPNQIKFDAQAQILHEMNSPYSESNILFMPKLFDDIMNKILEAVFDIGSPNDKSEEERKHTINLRPIEIDLVQKIVGLINNEFNEVNRELIDLDLSLSGVVMEEIHLLVVIYLTILYYNEQKKHFDEQIETLNVQKQSLQQYFISVIVPDALLDKEAGKELTTQVHNTLQRELTVTAHEIIKEIWLSQQKLSRKELQNVCDGKLQTADVKWLKDYIEKPTDIIVQEFHQLWDTIKKEIEKKIAKAKDDQKIYLLDFFHLIHAMKTALSGQGPAPTFVDDLFINPSGTTAEQNLTNKGQCMVLLLFWYFKNTKIDEETTFTVFDCIYKLTTKAVNYFQKRAKPDAGTARLFDSMTKWYKASNATSTNTISVKAAQTTNTTSVTATTSGATVTSLRISSVKNFADFLHSIISNEDEVMKNYEENISTLFSSYDKDKMYMRLLDKAKGCSVKCPCCERTCDADHTSVKSQPGKPSLSSNNL
ncbi:unnamed protein product [Rotaria magnacalcarata]|uniref:VLIG-type G domain-containing protein n=2 Tax=Rotaria magnacalcarata TaxID=392030 RepID=A0A8S2JDZ0_9BILA|nr:unnamed protein product [Rotaria magnacalcarata]